MFSYLRKKNRRESLKINNKSGIIKVWLITKVKSREAVVTLTDDLYCVIINVIIKLVLLYVCVCAKRNNNINYKIYIINMNYIVNMKFFK